MTEVSPADAARVLASAYANLVRCDANRVLVGIFNRYADSPLADRRVRQALNLAVNRQRVITEGLGGYAHPLCALTPPWCSGFPSGLAPYPHNPQQARALLTDAGWPEGRPLHLATPEPFAGIARLVADDVQAVLDIAINITVVPDDKLLTGSRMLIEKKLPPPWDMLLFGWFDLSSEAPPAAVHREFFGSDGAFRAGPELPEFDRLYSQMATQLDGATLVKAAEQIDRYVYDEALALFLCAPQALYAVNKHVKFGPYRTTFELAETEVDAQHWSRRGATTGTTTTQTATTRTGFSGASSGHAC